MKAKRIKATFIPSGILHTTYQDHWLLPADAESYERMVKQVARGLHGGSWTYDVGEDISREAYRTDARAALRAIGITQPRKAKGSK